MNRQEDEHDDYDGLEPWPDDWTEGPEWLNLLEELKSESPRGRVLVFAFFLEDFVGRALKAFFIDNDAAHKLLEGFSAPLATFSAKTAAAAALGLITKEEYTHLDAFRAARNAYAHSVNPNFEDKRVKRALVSLTTGYGLQNNTDPETVLVLAGSRLSLALLNRASHVSKSRLREKEWPFTRPD